VSHAAHVSFLRLPPTYWARVQDRDAKGKSLSRPMKLHMPRSILDCFTGKYVYEVYKVWREAAQRLHEQALLEEHAHAS
jgi:hypothetical protein